MIYEYHISVDSEKIMIPMWKQTIFNNIDSRGVLVREEIILTSTMDFDNNVEAMVYPGLVIDAYFPESKAHVTRVKIECPLDSRPFMANYYEAHFKMKTGEFSFENSSQLYHDFFRQDVSRSRNKNTQALWATIRKSNPNTLKEEARVFALKYGAFIEEKDIEGVIFDSSPYVDYLWMSKNVG